MKQHSIGKRLAVVFLAALVVAALIPLGAIGDRAYASVALIGGDPDEKTIDGMGTSGIKAPSAPEANILWRGSFVWFGKYDGEPVKYRVLDPKATKYGGTTLFLDCDSILYKAAYDVNGIPDGISTIEEWSYSDVRAGLNGASFLMKENGFTSRERSAISASIVHYYGHSHDEIIGLPFGSYIGLTGEKIFLLECEDVINPLYGYIRKDIGDSRVKKFGDTYEMWWIRSRRWGYSHCAGRVDDHGVLDFFSCDEDSAIHGVSPAFNIDLSSILFSTCIRGIRGNDGAEYKLTLKDDGIRLALRDGVAAYYSGDRVIVHYTLSGENAKNCTRMSILVLDKEYTPGNTNDATVYYYMRPDLAENVMYGSDLTRNDTVSFDLHEIFAKEGWNDGYYVYLLAEEENYVDETDYASEPILIPVPAEVAIQTQPDNASVSAGATAKFSVRATGSGSLAYQWQSRKNSSSTWVNSGQTGAKTANLTVATNAGLDGYQFRCIVSDSAGNRVISKTATLSIALTITKQPAKATVAAGAVAEFSITATGKAPLTYQWQSRKNSSTSWVNSGQQGAKTSKLSVATNAGLDGYQFRCIVTDGKGTTKTSETATLSIDLTITKQPSNVTVTAGKTAQYSVTATGKGPFTYQWQSRKNSSASWVNSGQQGAKTSKLSVATNGGLDGYQFRCVVTDGKGITKTSDVATLSITLTISKQPQTYLHALPDSTAKFTVTAAGKPQLTYQWQSRKNSSAAWVNSGQSGARSATLSVATNSGLNGYQFRCIVKDGKGKQVISDTARLVIESIVITSEPASHAVQAGDTTTFQVEAIGKGTLTYQWQSRKNDASSWVNSGQKGARSDTLMVVSNAGLHDYQFRCVVSDGYGNKTTSSAAFMWVVPKVTGSQSSYSVYPGDVLNLSVEASGKAPLTYQWEYSTKSNGPRMKCAQSDATTPNLRLTITSEMDDYIYYCTVTDGNGEFHTHLSALISVL